MENKKKRVALVFGIIFVLIIMMGSVYAFFSYQKESSAFVLTSSEITAKFTEGSNEIDFTNAYPISDKFALKNLASLKYVDFTVSSKAVNPDEAVRYEIYLTEKDGNTLDNRYIKVYLTDELNDGIIDPTKYSELANTTYQKDIDIGKLVFTEKRKGVFEQQYRIYVWLDQDYTQNEVSQKFSFKVNLYAYNDTSDDLYTVTFNYNDNVTENKTKQVEFRKEYGKLPNPTREGYEFAGWYLDQNFETEITKNTEVSTESNHNLYAKWLGGTYTISYNGNGSTSGYTESSTHTYGITSTLTPNGYSKSFAVSGFETAASRKSDGAVVTNGEAKVSTYTFSGWSTTKDGDKVYDDEASVTILTNMELFAKWSGGNVTLPTIERAGYACGWTKDESGTTVTYMSGDSFTPTDNTTLYGVCVEVGNTITLDANGGVGGTPSISVQTNSNVITPSTINTATKNYTVDFNILEQGATANTNELQANVPFMGYFTSSSGGDKVIDVNNQVASLVANVSNYTDSSGNWLGGDKTLYAQFNEESTQTLTLPNIEKTGYICKWNTQENGTGTSFNGGDSYTPTSNTTLYGICSVDEIKGLTITPDLMTLYIGATMDTEVSMTSGFEDTSRRNYTSSNTSVATINSSTGKITGVGTGVTTITVTAYDYGDTPKTATVQITVGRLSANNVGYNSPTGVTCEVGINETNCNVEEMIKKIDEMLK